MTTPSPLFRLISIGFGTVVIAIGLLNTFWGNDPGFGIFLLLLSLVYFPGVTAALKQRFGISTPLLVKIGLGMFILWAALGVGELPDKISMMLEDLGYGTKH